MDHPCSWITLQSVSLHRGLQLCVPFFSPLMMNSVCILLWYPNKWFPIGLFRCWLPGYHLRPCNLDRPLCPILLSFFFYWVDNMHQTLHPGIQCLCTMLFYHCILLWMFKHIWKQICGHIIPVIEWMKFWHTCELKFESTSHIYRNLPAHIEFHLKLIGLIKISKLHEQCESWLLLDGFALDVRVIYETRSILNGCSGFISKM